MSYKLISSVKTTDKGVPIKRLSDGAFIPQDPSNPSYQEYLEWVKAGNTPQAAD
tara:strand:+ start:1186 stop:1347 length:162 start_codon:yes stop_codon:yes gene_type:complete